MANALDFCESAPSVYFQVSPALGGFQWLNGAREEEVGDEGEEGEAGADDEVPRVPAPALASRPVKLCQEKRRTGQKR